MRPRVLINCAVSHDGHLAGPDGAPVRLSDDEDMRRVHAMRASVDAILVGVGTVIADDPGLTVKRDLTDADGGDPVRVVLDTDLRTPPGSRVLDGSVETLVYHATDAADVGAATAVKVPRRDDGLDLGAVLDDLGERGIESVMVEGGADVIASFLRQGLWDECTVYQAPVELGGGPSLPAPARLREWGVVEGSAVAQGEGWLRTYVRA